MELVIGIGLIAVIAGVIAITAAQSLQNSQFSKNQVEATKKAQENIEKVRTIKNKNFGVCTQQEVLAGNTVCSTWDDIWSTAFGQHPNCTNGCTFILASCSISSGGVESIKPFCLKYSASREIFVNSITGAPSGFTGEVIVEDEAPNQKKVTSKVYWRDSSSENSSDGEHSSNLVTILSRL